MSLHRTDLPQLDTNHRFLTDGGLETTLVFHDGMDLPGFASFPLLHTPEGRERLRGYAEHYLALAEQHNTGFILETPTWRTNPDWGQHLGYTTHQLEVINREAVAELVALREAWAERVAPLVISGCIGPRGDGYVVGNAMTPEEAHGYHCTQIATFAATAADMVTAFTLSYSAEAIGIALAAREANMPCVIGFTVETDGRLPSGETLQAAIEAVDAATDGTPAYYMVNCAHPTHFAHVLADAPWMRRIQALRANASTCSHAELDEATELDAGNPVALGQEYAALVQRFPHLNVLGGCCGTDHRHLAHIAEATAPVAV
ncbi:MAG: homocysteine S-methyltransferase family protein [Rhodothermales bacterium]